jgi:hypothetical protein
MDANGIEKLKKDLDILAAMAAEMDDYLRSDVQFWPLQNGNMPRLTLGGYLMRQHRLAALAHLLPEADKSRLTTAMETFREALGEKIVRFETKAQEELDMRLRQWEGFLRNLGREDSIPAYYATSVETRAMIAALRSQLQIAPYRLSERAAERINLLDRQLRNRFQSGDFIWPEEWRPAYAQDRYWWLYGRPGQSSTH